MAGKRKFRLFKKKERKLNRSFAGNTLLFVLMGICGVAMAIPLVMILNNCLKPLDELFQYPPKLFVKNPTLENFSDLFILMNDSWVPFSRYIMNTIIITGGGIYGKVTDANIEQGELQVELAKDIIVKVALSTVRDVVTNDVKPANNNKKSKK